jgi:tetratricopeptide (TPR) repeat protein
MSSDAMDAGEKPQESASDHDDLASSVSDDGAIPVYIPSERSRPPELPGEPERADHQLGARDADGLQEPDGEPDQDPDEVSDEVSDEDIDEDIDDSIEMIDDLEEIVSAAAITLPKAPPPPPKAPPLPGAARAQTESPAESPAEPAEPALELELELEIDRPTVVERAAEALGRATFAARADHLQYRLETSADPDRMGIMSHELGQLYERRLGDEEQARAAYEQARDADPSLRANLWAMRRQLYRQGLWAELVLLIEAEIDYGQSDEERADLYVEKGHIFEDRLGDLEEARVAYEYAADLIAPDTASGALIPALMGLERVALVSGEHGGLERIWTRLAEVMAEPEHKLVYLLDMVALQAERGDVEQAQETIAAAAALGVDRDRVARQRLRIAEAAHDMDGMLAGLEAHIAQLAEKFGPAGMPELDAIEAGGGADAGSAEQPGRERTLRLKVAALRRRQARVVLDFAAERPDVRDELFGRAWDYLSKALALAPGEALLLADLTDLADTLGYHEGLAELCQRWQEVESDPARALGLSLRRAEALLHAGQREEAHELLDALSASAPGFLPITALRERDALTAQDWPRLARAYADAATAAGLGTSFMAAGDDDAQPDPAWAASLHVSAGELFAREAGDLDQARDHYGKALEARPGYPPAVEALCELYNRTGELDQAAALLESCLQGAGQTGDDSERERERSLLDRLCRIYEELGDSEGALAAQTRLLAALGPDSPDGTRLLWRIESTLGSLGRAGEQVELLVDLAERLVDPARRGQALYRAARLCETRLEDPARAADLYRQVIDVWPGDRYARAALVTLLRRAGRWDELVAERKTEAAELADGPSLARALREAAVVLHRELGRRREAADVYRALLDRVPGHAGALRSLVELFEAMAEGKRGESRTLAELIEVLEQESALDESAEARATALLRLGMAYERAGRSDEAMDAYRRAAELAPGSALALVAMVELAAQSGDDFSYIETLGQLAQGRPDPLVKSEILEDVGWLWANTVEDMDRAAEAFDEAARLGESQRPGPALGKLLLQAKQGDVAASGETLVQLANAVGSPAAAAALMLRAAVMAESEGNPEAVQDRLFGALNLAPEDQDTLMLAAEYARAIGPEDSAGQAQLLGRAELFGMRASLATEQRSRLDWELARAEALEGAGRSCEAVHVVQAVLAARPDHLRALQLLRRACRRGGDRQGQARACLALARMIEHAESKCALVREAAAIYDSAPPDAVTAPGAGAIGDPAAVLAIYRYLLDHDPGAAEFYRATDICREHDDITSLFEILSGRLHWLDTQGQDSAAAKVPLLYERAVLRQRVGDERGAIRDRAQVVAIDPGHGPALWEQAQAMIAAGESEPAAALLGLYLQVEAEPQRRAEAELTLSRILAEEMDDVAGAIEQLESVVEQSPDDLEVRERFIKLLGRKGDWERVIEQIGELATRRAMPGERARDELRAAEIARDKLGDAGRAREALDRARNLDPLNIEVVRQLAGLFESEPDQRRQALNDAIHDLVQEIARSPAEARLYERLAVVQSWLDDRDAQYYALCAVQALGSLAADKKQMVVAQAAALAAVPMPSSVLSADDWNRSMGAGLAGSADGTSEVWNAIAEAVTRCQGLEPGQLGFSRGDKQSSRQLGKRFASLVALVDSFGVSGAEYYIADSKPGYARVLSLARPVLCLGTDVASVDSAANRFLLGRAVALARLGAGSLLELRAGEVAGFLAAAAQIAGVSPLPPALAAVVEQHRDQVDDSSRELQKQLGWRDKRTLAQVFERAGSMGAPDLWRRTILAMATRAGLLVAGDAGAALEVLDARRGGRSRVDDPMVLDLLVWMVSQPHLDVRRKLGMATRT